jgi:hypothetical protein
MNSTLLARTLAAGALALACATQAQATSLNALVDLAGWNASGNLGFGTSQTLNLGTGVTEPLILVTGFRIDNLTFTAAADSWLVDLSLQVTIPNPSSGSPYMELIPTLQEGGGSAGPLSGAWDDGELGFSNGAPFSIATTPGSLLVTAFSNYVASPGETLDLRIQSGTLTVIYQPVPEPGSYLMFTLGLLAVGGLMRARASR